MGLDAFYQRVTATKRSLLVFGEKLAAPEKSGEIGGWGGCCKVFSGSRLRRLRLGGRWEVWGVGDKLIGSGIGKWLWCKELGSG